ncbi:MAG: ATP-binding protein [Cyanobacteria bacterium P01_A01_bin.40]
MSKTRSDSVLFPVLEDEYLEGLKACGAVLEIKPGEILYQEGDSEYCFYVVLSGQIKITKHLGTEEILVATHHRGEFTGDLNMLTGGVSQATASSIESSQVIQFQDFKELLKGCPRSIDLFIPALAERSKYLEAKLRQQEKLAELGKLSAGLAHELNNPAAAGSRAAKQLNSAIATLQENMLSPRGQNFSVQHRQLLCELQQKAVNREYYKPDLSPLKQSIQEEELADWLESLGVDDAWDISPSLVNVGIEQSHLETLAEEMESDAFNEALTWLEATLTVNSLVTELEFSTSQISDLVGAIKNYSYVDRGAIQEIDLHQGLDNTLKILNHKLKYGVTVNREYSLDLPKVSAYGGELNQVWTNLIDNAIDAMNGQGELTIRTSLENNCILVEIIDNGAGIPLEFQSKIFDPFFTSKAAGKGSGLGLDISRGIVVKKHKGNLRFESEPGKTNFQVRIPIKQYV